MFRRMVTRMGLPTLACLGLLLIGGPAKADPQGWPLQGGNTQSFFSQGRTYRTFSPELPGSYSPDYYSVDPSSIPQAGSNYGSASMDYYYGASTTEASPERAVRINVRVPADAKIWFDGTETIQTGMARSFESPPLTAGLEYAYHVRIQWQQDGNVVSQSQPIIVHAGDEINLTLGSSYGSLGAR